MLRFTDLALFAPDSVGELGYSTEFNVIERDDDARIAVFHSRMQHPRMPSVETGDANLRDLTLFVDAIVFDSVIYNDIETDFNLAELLIPTATRVLTHEDTQAIGSLGRHDDFSEGDVILEPMSLNLSFEAEGHPMVFSAIGIIDGRLHLQFYGGGNTFAFPVLQNADGEILDEFFATSFRLDADNNFQSLRTLDEHGNWLWNGNEQFWEFVFEADLNRLDEYRLIFRSFLVLDEIILNRAVSFILENEIAIPPPRDPVAEREALETAVFGDISRRIDIYDENGEFAGMLIAVIGRAIVNSATGEIETGSVEIDVLFNSNYGVFNIREDHDSIPPQFYDEIMYHTEIWFALE
jgi:hypothetical protein